MYTNQSPDLHLAAPVVEPRTHRSCSVPELVVTSHEGVGMGTLYFHGIRTLKQVGDHVVIRPTFAAIDSCLMAYVPDSATLIVVFCSKCQCPHCHSCEEFTERSLRDTRDAIEKPNLPCAVQSADLGSSAGFGNAAFKASTNIFRLGFLS